MADLTDIENVKKWVQSDMSTDDELFQRLVTAASEFFITMTERDNLDSVKDYTEKRDGQGGHTMVLKHYPVTAITSVSIDGVVIPASNGVSFGWMWSGDSRTVALIGRRFTPGYSNVVISYSAGFDIVPPDVEQAVVELAALRYSEFSDERVGIQAKNLGVETVTYLAKDMPPQVATVVSKYQQKLPL